MSLEQINEFNASHTFNGQNRASVKAYSDELAASLKMKDAPNVDKLRYHKQNALFEDFTAGAYDPKSNTLGINQQGLKDREWLSMFGGVGGVRGEEGKEEIQHEILHAYVHQRGIDTSNYRVNKELARMGYITPVIREESFIRALQGHLDDNSDKPIYYNEKRGKFTQGGIMARARHELGIID